MKAIRKIWATLWRSILVGVVYVLALIAVGVLSSLIGVQMSGSSGRTPNLVWLLNSGILIGLFLGPLASLIYASRWRHFLIWSSVIFFNMGSVAIEGAFFAPELVPIPLPILFIQQLLASVAAAFMITWLFSSFGKMTSFMSVLSFRPWFAWTWRFVVSSLAYLLFYFVFGAINYNLVTEPYYSSHVGGLTVPPQELILIAEVIRAPLIVLSVALFILSAQANRRQLAWRTGLMLFGIGGVVPLLLQVDALPLLLLSASGVEIFFQNFFTGTVAVMLFWTPQLHATTSIQSP